MFNAKCIFIVCATACITTLHARTFDEELIALYQQKPYLTNQSHARSPDLFFVKKTHVQKDDIDTARLNRSAGMVGLAYALTKIGYHGYLLHNKTPDNHAWFNPLHAFNNCYTGTRFFMYAAQVALEAICLKTAVYFLLLSYYGDVFDVVEHSAKKMKNMCCSIF